MAPADKPELLSSGAGLGAAVAVESGTELGEIGPVRARGYWEQVWRRFRRDKAAIISGAFIIFLLLAAYPGAALVSLLLGHGPNDIYGTNGLDPNTLLPVGPFSHVEKLDGSGTSLFILGRLAHHRDRDGLPGAPLHHRAREHRRRPSQPRHIRLPPARRVHPDGRDRDLRLVLPGEDHQGSGAVPPGEGVRGGRPHDRGERRAHHPLAPGAPPRRADHRLLDPDHRPERPARSRALVPRDRDPARRAELGQPALNGTRLLPCAAVADDLAGARAAHHHPCLQPPRRRAPRLVRPPRCALANRSLTIPLPRRLTG